VVESPAGPLRVSNPGQDVPAAIHKELHGKRGMSGIKHYYQHLLPLRSTVAGGFRW